MSLVMEIGQGAGLAGATGVRPFLPPLLAGGLARNDIGIDFDGTDWRFLESTGFLLAVFALAVLWYGAERSRANRSARDASDTESAAVGEGAGRAPLELFAAALGLMLGGLLFAASLEEGGNPAWPGLLGGVACAALAWASLGGLFERARRRLGSGPSDFLALYAEGAALLLAGIAVALPPASFLALAAFVVLLVRGRDEAGRKYAGLRVLR